MFTAFLINSAAFARTYPVSTYEEDQNHNWSYNFGIYETNPDNPNYLDPNFEEALSLPSPLYNPLYASYDVIVIANKTDLKIAGTELVERGQTVRVYARKEALERLSERLQFIQGYDESSGLLFYWTSSTARPGKTTPSGYYTPESFSSDHKSSLYNNAPMPWTVFFNSDIGSHGVKGGAVKDLGTPASAGCVRLEPQRARDLFHLVGQIGKGAVDKLNKSTGTPYYDKDGKPIQHQQYKTLYVIRD